ncbi:MAG: PAAR domain-containing protein [Bacteroidales bacterium]|nr:PAAR domain-containing protein [Bacteroidales bacterium]MBK9359049.1 PAAR domain-containing protein [Bacteroidales bacterium]
MLPAARMTDLIVSPATSGVPAPVIPPCSPNILINNLPAARVTDGCGADVIAMGSNKVLFNGLPAARVTSVTAAGGAVLPPGSPNVLIG